MDGTSVQGAMGQGEVTQDHKPQGAVNDRAKPEPVARLKHRSEFLRAARGRRTGSRSFSLQSLQRPADDDCGAAPRFGLTVTKKTGGAVERNRIRRRLRAALRMPGLLPEPGHDYVIVARREALSAVYTDLVGELAKALKVARGDRARQRGGRARGVESP